MRRPDRLRAVSRMAVFAGVRAMNEVFPLERVAEAYERMLSKVLLAAKRYANDPLKTALTAVFCTFEG